MLKQGASVHLANSQGHTPLHLASMYGYDQICEVLIAKKAKINVVDMYRRTPLMVAYGADYTISKMPKSDITVRLLKCRAKVEVQDKQGWTALHHAASMGNSSALQHLLIKGKAKANRLTNDGYTALFHIVLRAHSAAMDALLAKGVNVDLTGKGNMPPLYRAILSNQPALAVKLIEHGAELKIKDSKGNTYLHNAITTCQQEVVRALLTHRGTSKCPERAWLVSSVLSAHGESNRDD